MRSLTLLLLPAALVACTTGKDDSGLSDTLDRDNDGFPESQDCNDLDAQIHPDAFELCDEIDNNCNGTIDEDAFDATPWFVDGDGDNFGTDGDFIYACTQPSGYSYDRTDCNDRDISAYPGATEVCDNVDNDCDGQIDEGTAADAATWYRDGDSDGYGSSLASVNACSQPTGYVSNSSDCNDGVATINPGVSETCNGIDDDCDTLIDDDDTSTTGGTDFYLDADGDMWGLASTKVNRCEQPLGYVPVSGDCDDSDPHANPDKAEVCGDEIDNDCDGSADEEDAPHLLNWYTDADGDGYGSSTSSPRTQCAKVSGRVSNNLDCNDSSSSINPAATETWYDGVDGDCDGGDDYDADQDGYRSSRYGGTDCDDSNALVNPAMAEICGDGDDNDCDGKEDPCTIDTALYGEEAGDRAGEAVAGGGDINGDGYDDLVVGSSWYNGSLIEDVVAVGAAYIAYGPISGAYNLSLSDAKIEGASGQDRLGSGLSIVGDVDNDGYDDLLVGAFGVDTGGAVAGAAYLFKGPLSGLMSADAATAVLVGELAGDRAGSNVAGGDFSGDNKADLLIGAYNALGASDAASGGAAYLVLGTVTGSVDLSFARTALLGEQSGDWAGFSVANAGDVNADGVADILIGAPFLHPAGLYVGGAYVVFGPPSTGDVSLEDADRRYLGTTNGDRAGYSVAGAGDINGDGRSDILVGATNNDLGAAEAGAAYLISGSASSGLVSSALAVFLGERAGDYAGSSVAGPGDINRDGRNDVVIGAARENYSGSDAGAAYIYLAPLSGSLSLTDAHGKIVGAAADDYLGASISGAGDVNRDGYKDVIVGVPGEDTLGTNAGAAFMLFGSAF